MCLLRIVLGVAVWLRSACHGRRLLDVVGVDGHHASGGLVRRHCGNAAVRVRDSEGDGGRDSPVDSRRTVLKFGFKYHAQRMGGGRVGDDA